MRLLRRFACAGRKSGRVRPCFFDHVQLIELDRVSIGELGHNRVIGLGDVDRVRAFVLVSFAGHTQQLSPIVNFRVTVRVHRAVDHNGRQAIEVGTCDRANVVGVGCLGEAFVMVSDINVFCPFRVSYDIYLVRCAFVAFVDDRPVGRDPFALESELHRLGLKVVIVAAAASDQQDPERGGGVR